MSKAMGLKAKIRNIAKNKNLPAQVILQNYMFERLLVRLSKTEYRDKLVLKGGMLVAAIVGLNNRATMDLDTTLKNHPLVTVESRGSRAARSSRLTSVGWRPAACPRASCDRPASLRARRRLLPKAWLDSTRESSVS